MRLPEVIENLPKHVEWRWERIGWGLMATIVLAELLGVFGGGYVADTRAEEESDAAHYLLRYEQWNRYSSTTTLYVTVDGEGLSGDRLDVAFSPQLVDGWMIRSSEPGAAGSSLGPLGSAYNYSVDEWSEPVHVTYEYIPTEIGVWNGAITITAGNDPPVTFEIPQRIFP